MNPAMDYPSYKALCASPDVTAEFLERTVELVEQFPPAERRRRLVESVKVAGKPLSEAMFLATLEMSTGHWDDDEPALRRFTAAAARAHAANPDLDVPGFVFGWATMPGSDARLEAARTKVVVQGEVSANLMAPPTMRGSVLSAGKPAVTVSVNAEPALRMRMR